MPEYTLDPAILARRLSALQEKLRLLEHPRARDAAALATDPMLAAAIER